MLEDRDNGLNTSDNIDGLLHDTFRNVAKGFNEQQGARDGLNEEAKKFFQVGGGW